MPSGDDMDSRAEGEQEAPLSGETVGMSEAEGEAPQSSHEAEGEVEGSEHKGKKRPTGWERLKQKNRDHEREIRDLQSRIDQMQTMLPQQGQPQDPNMGGQQGNPMGVDEQIHKAVSYALRHKEEQEAKAHQAQQAMHVQKQYEGLHNHLDRMSDKYDDFDDRVRGQEVPITEHMRDASLFLPQEGQGSAGEVLYHLTDPKNRAEFDRIRSLHPLEQAREMNKLSRSLEIGGNKGAQSATPRTLGNIKNNPVSNNMSVTDKTPVSELRQKMRAGGKRWY